MKKILIVLFFLLLILTSCQNEQGPASSSLDTPTVSGEDDAAQTAPDSEQTLTQESINSLTEEEPPAFGGDSPLYSYAFVPSFGFVPGTAYQQYTDQNGVSRTLMDAEEFQALVKRSDSNDEEAAVEVNWYTILRELEIPRAEFEAFCDTFRTAYTEEELEIALNYYPTPEAYQAKWISEADETGKFYYTYQMPYFTDSEIELLYSGTKEEVYAYFLSPYALLVKDTAYSPKWLYTHNAEDYRATDISSEMIREVLPRISATFKNFIRPNEKSLTLDQQIESELSKLSSAQ